MSVALTSSLSSVALTAAALVGSALSAPMPQDDVADNPATTDDSFEISGSAIPAGIILIIVGLAILLFGARLWRLSITIIGGYFFAMLAWILLVNIEPSSGWESHLLIYYITIGIAFVIGALISWWLYKLGVFIFGAIVGADLFFFASAIIGLDSLVGSIVRYVILVVVAIVFGLLALKFEPYFARIGTAIVGAGALILGIDIFAKTGVWQNVQQAVENKTSDTVRDPSTIAMIVSFFILAILGSLIQFKKTAPMTKK